MKKIQLACETRIKVNTSVEGETIENKLRRITQQGEPVTDNAPLIYTERKDGVMPEYNIRADKFDIAIDALDIGTANRLAKREALLKKQQEESEAQPTQATEPAA